METITVYLNVYFPTTKNAQCLRCLLSRSLSTLEMLCFPWQSTIHFIPLTSCLWRNKMLSTLPVIAFNKECPLSWRPKWANHYLVGMTTAIGVMPYWMTQTCVLFDHSWPFKKLGIPKEHSKPFISGAFLYK
jgi:hypothetical protein